MIGVARLVLVLGWCVSWSPRVFAQTTGEPGTLDDVVLPTPDAEFVLPKTDFPDPNELEPALGRALKNPQGFCENERYELEPSEKDLCHLARAGQKRCPGFVKACESSTSAASGADSQRRAKSKGERSLRPEGSAGPLGEFLAKIVEIVFWGVIVVGIAAMAWAIGSALVGRRRDRKHDEPPGAGEAMATVPVRLLSGSPEELLARSRELAMAGNLRAAMSVALRALLRHLEIGGRLELHPSRTNGDYVRSLRRQGHDPRDLRLVVREVEAVEFGGARPSPEAFSALHTRVSKLVQVAGFVVACFCLGALGGCRNREPLESTVHSCGTGADGYAALCETLGARGANVRRRFTEIEGVTKDVSHVVVVDDELQFAERKILLDWVERGGTLVTFDRPALYDERLSFSRPCGSELALDRNVWNVPPGAKHRFHLPETLGLDFDRQLVIARELVTCGDQAFAVQLYRGDGTIVVLADRRLATNAGLAIGDNAALVAAVVAPSGGTVELVGEWTGTGSDLPLESLARSGLVPWFLQILLFGFVLALYRGAPFGTRREPVSVTRRAFAEHALALGDAYHRARASGLALVHFGGWALERLRVRLAATRHGRLSDLASAVATRHAVNEAEVMKLVVAVRSAEDHTHDSANEAEHLAALRRLAALVKTTGGSS